MVGTKIVTASVNYGSLLDVINFLVLIMFTAKIFKVNDLSWWIVFSPYLSIFAVALFIKISNVFFKVKL